MTTLEAIAITLSAGGVIFTLAMILFGFAIRYRSIFIAPRCTARPKETTYNPNPTHSNQDRGTAIFGWIPWCLKLTYPQMLEGVPGTGTRKGGAEGSFLKVNLDGIVLLRFNSLCLRVTFLATILCLVMILPLNLSAQCFEYDEDVSDVWTSIYCESNTSQTGEFGSYNLSNYEKTTLANIPQLSFVKNITNDPGYIANLSTVWGWGYSGQLARLYAIVFCSWIITIYTFVTARKEWLDIHAMRRVYYMEPNIWENRKKEHQVGLLNSATDEGVARRDPWIPHPEQRETVPSIELYSVLVGSLPRLPGQIVKEDDVEKAVVFSKRQSIDWQLEVTKTFFDQCVPNQPGFSSSVVAVTILPGHKKMSIAWSKWNRYAKALRRLKFIRRLVRDLRYYDIDPIDSEPTHFTAESKRRRFIKHEKEETGNGVDLLTMRSPESTFQDEELLAERMVYTESLRNIDYYKKVFSSYTDGHDEEIFLHSQVGPEQTAVYSRELAQSASACCPNGCHEQRLRRARIDDLTIHEQDAIANVQDAYAELKQARDEAADIQSEVDFFADQPNPNKENLPPGLSQETEILEKARQKGRGSQQSREVDIGIAPDKKIPGENLDSFQRSTSSHFLDLTSGGVRKRFNKKQCTHSKDWQKVQQIVNDAQSSGDRRNIARYANAGRWRGPSLLSRAFVSWITEIAIKTKTYFTLRKDGTHDDDLARESTYAVVTFTSRQAAVAARNCIMDGRGENRWLADNSLPVAPLADSSPCTCCPCRGCCRPVTLTLPDRQKLARKLCCLTVLATIYIFYAVPLSIATGFANPDNYDKLLPIFKEFKEAHPIAWARLSGILPALIWVVFFALCPVMFKIIANIGSGARSVMNAETVALKYYWWFMVFTAFSGNLLSSMVINGFNEGIRIGSEFEKVLTIIALTVPTTISAQWLNWIIVRFTITLPLNYMLQFNTFLFWFLKWNCCKRQLMGGGPGGPIPYRLYVDAGVVFMCVVALAPASPLLAPTALVYFLYCEPVLRRNVIFMYRPKFDGGGIRWPFLFDMLVSSIVVGQILLATMMALKEALGPAIIAAMPIIPTILHRLNTRKRFLEAFKDAALLQTSTLDGWDPTESTSLEKREELRRFLVDAHKAAYVPVCIAGCEKGSTIHKTLTAEPAVVVPNDNDVVNDDIDDNLESLSKFLNPSALGDSGRDSQYGATLRRVSCQLPTPKKPSVPLYSCNDDGSVSTSFKSPQREPYSNSILVQPAATSIDVKDSLLSVKE